MVEGSGFLQWVSVYALALSPEYDVVLLDEPDAHLHPLLQQQLVDRLGDVSEKKNKQILLATHSTELIRSYDHEKILCLNKGKGKYLLGSEDKVKVLSGIGAVHTTTFHSLIQHKKLLILEAKSDERFLKILAERAGYEWPENLVLWHWTGPVKERSKLFRLLKMEIRELQAISIRDRDDEPDNSVDSDLIDKSMKDPPDGFYPLKWRRRHIENYLLCLAAIARAANKSKEEVKLFVGDNHGLALPDNTSLSEVLPAIRDARGKEIMTEGEMSMKAAYKISREDIACGLEKNEIAEDIKMLFRYIDKICHG